MVPAKCALLVGLAACSSTQPSVENVANESGATATQQRTVAIAPSTSPTTYQVHTCTSAAPFTVQAVNKTAMPIDLCAAFERALAKAVQTVTFGPPGTFQVEVALKDAQSRWNNTLSCNLSIGVDANGKRFAQSSGGASVGPPLQLALEDCVEAVLDNQLTGQIAPLMQRHLAAAAASAQPAAGTGSASPGPTP